MRVSLEKTRLTLGVIPLIDATPVLVARDLGFFARHGLDVEVVVESAWASIRDKIVAGLLDAAQMLAPMPLAATLGIDGIGVPMVTALSLNLNGNSIAVSESLYRELGLIRREPVAVGAALRTLLAHERAQGLPPRVFAHVFPFSTHHYQLRYWLAASGIDPDQDLRLVVVPPQLTVAHLRAGRIDGFCAGAPWGAVAEQAGVGQRILNSRQIWNNAPEKVLGVTRDWALAHPNTHRALVAALIDACRWLDEPEHRVQAAQCLIDAAILDAPPATIRSALEAPVSHDPFLGAGLVFHHGAANFPWLSQAVWFIEQMRRWNQLPGDSDALGLAREVYLPDLYRAAAAAVGVTSPATDDKAEGEHAEPWSLQTPEGPILMGSNQFFDGRVYRTG